jgi:hypothetical protein
LLEGENPHFHLPSANYEERKLVGTKMALGACHVRAAISFPLPRAWPFVNVGAADMPIGCARTFWSNAASPQSFKQIKLRNKRGFVTTVARSIIVASRAEDFARPSAISFHTPDERDENLRG